MAKKSAIRKSVQQCKEVFYSRSDQGTIEENAIDYKLGIFIIEGGPSAKAQR